MTRDKMSSAGPDGPAEALSDPDLRTHQAGTLNEGRTEAAPSLGDMLRAVVADVRTLVQARVGLARAEVSSRIELAKYGAILLTLAGVLALALVTTALITLVFIVSEWMGFILALVLVLLLFGGITFLLAMRAVRALKQAFATKSATDGS